MRQSSRITWYLALVAAGAAAVAGILVGHHRNRKAPALRWAGSMRFVRTPPLTARGPGRGPANLAFTSPRLGFAATTGGAHDVPRVGWAPPTDVGRMQRTDDGGATWKTLWSGRRIAFDGIAVLGQTVVASAAVNPRDLGMASSGRLLLASHDGGRTWREKRPPPGDAAVQPMTSRIWIASSPRSVYPDEHGATLFRSGDGGSNWRRLAVPRAAELVRFATPSLGFASAYAQTCQSLRKRWTSIDYGLWPIRQLWRTADGGRTWHPVPGTCGPPLADLNVVTPRLIFSVQSDEDGRRASLLRRSSDGGRTWRTIARQRGHRYFQVAFANSRDGLLVDWEENMQDAYVKLAVTTDGGRTWTRRGMPAASTVAFARDGRHAWVGADGDAVVWRTADGGQTWRLSTQPRFLDPLSVDLAHPNVISVVTAAGSVETGNAGRTWAPSVSPSARALAVAMHTNAFMVWRDSRSAARRVIGRRRLGVVDLPPTSPSDPVEDVAFTTPRDGLAVSGSTVFFTHVGGRSWHRLAVPPGAYASAWAFIGPGVAVFVTKSRAFVTTDEGRNWTSLALRNAFYSCTVRRPSHSGIWLTCTDVTSKRPLTILFTSRDGGRTWVRRTSRNVLDENLAVESSSEAWAVTYVDPRTGRHPALWHTTDSGATWRQEWVELSSVGRVAQVDCLATPSGVRHERVARCR